MSVDMRNSPEMAWAEPALQVYLLGTLGFEAAHALQQRLVYQVAGDRRTAALVMCEHPPLITVGRHGSRSQILCEADELRTRRWPIRWVNRGGGCLLHLPGQLAVYPILPLDQLGLGVQAYLDRLHEVVIALLDDFSIRGETRPGMAGVWVGDRPIAGIGVAVRDWVTYYGAVLNVDPDLQPFRRIRFTCGGRLETDLTCKEPAMTSLARERHGPLRPALVRERLLEHFAARFGFVRIALLSDHPSLCRRAPADALAARS
jgi:lipoyl(octanoyl) transferase